MAGAAVHDLLLEGPWQHRDVAANGIRFHLAVGRRFAPERPLVVLLHGFGQLWWTWRHQIPALDAAGYAVAALDLRGCGASDQTPRGYDPETTASDVAGVVRSLGARRAVLVGHDWGGIAAWWVAAYAPGQVRALVLLAAPHPLAFPWRRALPDLAFCCLPLLPEKRLMAADGAYVEQLLRRRAADGSQVFSAAEARPYRAAMQRWPSPHCALAYPRMFLRDTLRPAGLRHRRALRRGTAVPLLSVHGQADRLVPVSSMSAAEAYVSGPSDLVSLPGVGHLPHEEAPEAVNRALLTWLGNVEPDRG